MTPSPRGARGADLQLRMFGDRVSWHLYAACLWLADGVQMRAGERANCEVLGSLEGKPPVDGVIDGDVDVAFTTPIAAGAMAYEGRGVYDKAHPELRAIAALPHRDRLALVLTEEAADHYGLRTLADVRDRKPPLRIIAGPEAGRNVQGFATSELLRRYGIARSDLERWGGTWLPYRGPANAAELIVDGGADGLVHDAIMTWHEFSSVRPMRLFPVASEVLDSLFQDYGLIQVAVSPGEYEGVVGHGPVLDWSQWLLVARESLQDEAAYLLAQAAIEHRAAFEKQYEHLPVRHSPLHYPIEPSSVANTAPVPLHPGAAAYYREIGALPA